MTSALCGTLDIIRYPPHHTHTTPTPHSDVWFVQSISGLHEHEVNTQTLEQISQMNNFTFVSYIQQDIQYVHKSHVSV